jgi:uncharacterized protein (DUF2141 family)
MNKPMIFTLFKPMLFGALCVMSQEINTKEITVHIENIDLNKPGNIMVMLYKKEGFPKDHSKALVMEILPIYADKMSVTFSSTPPEFAIKVLHDEDKTGQVTKNWTGIFPAEGLGFSNGAKLRFGPPTYQDARMTLKDVEHSTTITMIYP